MKDKKVAGVRFKLMPVFSDAIKPDAGDDRAGRKGEGAVRRRIWRGTLGKTDSLLYRRGNFNGTFDDLICNAMLAERDAEIALSPGFRWGANAASGRADHLGGRHQRHRDHLSRTAIATR